MNTGSKLRLFAAAALAALVLVSGAAVGAEDFENQKPGAPKWRVIDYNRVQTHPARVPGKIAGGIAFEFLNLPDTAQIGTSHPSYNGSLLGDLTGKTVSATIRLNVSGDTAFKYYGEPDACGRPANVRLYFQTDTGGKFAETDYWWSNNHPLDSVNLQTLVNGGTVTLSVPLEPQHWSNYNGKFGTFYTNGEFAAAVADVQFIGLSFGGGCFFANGVGVSQGGGAFQLLDYTVQ